MASGPTVCGVKINVEVNTLYLKYSSVIEVNCQKSPDAQIAMKIAEQRLEIIFVAFILKIIKMSLESLASQAIQCMTRVTIVTKL